MKASVIKMNRKGLKLKVIKVKKDQMNYYLKQIEWLNRSEKGITSKTRMMKCNKSFKGYLSCLHEVNN